MRAEEKHSIAFLAKTGIVTALIVCILPGKYIYYQKSQNENTIDVVHVWVKEQTYNGADNMYI